MAHGDSSRSPDALRGKEENVQQPSPKLVKVGILLGTLGLVLALIGCNNGSEFGNWSAYGEGGEESGPELAHGDTLIIGLAGAQLVLSYDSVTNAFKGTVENTTTATLRSVRVEVQLSNGIEIGPTTLVDLAPGQVVAITLRQAVNPSPYGSHT